MHLYDAFIPTRLGTLYVTVGHHFRGLESAATKIRVMDPLCPNLGVVCVVQVRYCLHVQQRLLKEQWPIKLAEHQMARTVSIGDLEGNGPGGQVLFNGLRVRMAINTGIACLRTLVFGAITTCRGQQM